MRGGLVGVQRARQHPIPQRHHHLDHARHARSRLRVPDVRLDRAQPQRPPRRPFLPVRRQQRLRLDRVTQRRPRPMRLHHIHVGRGQAGVRQRLTDDALLRGAVRRGQPVRSAVLVHRGAPHHRQHRMPVPPRIRKALQQDDAGPLGQPEAVGVVGERLAPAVGRQRPQPAEPDERVGSRHHDGAAREGHGALAVPQRLRGQVQGHQRRGTRRVHRHRRPLKTQRIRDTPRDDAGNAARHDVVLDGRRRFAGARAVSVGHGADEGSCAGATQRVRGDPGPFERLPRGLQQQPLLRVHRQRLTRTDPEERRVEAVRALDEAARPDVTLAPPPRVRVEQVGEVPAAVVGEVGDHVGALGNQPPQIFRAADATGETARHPHDRQRLLVRRAHHRGRGGGGRVQFQNLRAQMPRQRDGRRLVEDQRGRQPQSGCGGEPVAEFHRRQRLEPEVLEGAFRTDRLRRRVPEHGAGVGTDQVEQDAFLLRRRTAVELLPQFGASRDVPGRRALRRSAQRPARTGQFAEERARPHRREQGGERLPVDIGHCHKGVLVVECLLKCGDGQVSAHQRQSLPPDSFARRGRVEALHAAPRVERVLPDAPRHGRHGQPLGPALLRHGVEPRVGGGVRGVVAASPDSGDRGEQNEGVKFVPVEKGSEVLGPSDLRGQHRGKAVRGGAGHRGQLDVRGGVHDGTHRMPGVPQPAEQRLHRGTVTDIAGRQGDGRAHLRKLGRQFVSARGVGAGTADQHHVLGAAGGEPAGDARTEAAGGAGEQHRAPGLPVAPRCGITRRGLDHPPGERPLGTHRYLILAVQPGKHPAQLRESVRIRALGQIDQSAPLGGMLQGHDPAEAPHLRLPRADQRIG
ncbi:hypothetical protein STBA_68050 [Streptomyces sp. MP131-18]|nr:hypothetical protein STBA_68050 [Streptomyces sp. MP131-18]